MSVYDASGNSLQNVYSADGSELNEAFDASGNLVYRKGKISGYSIENVPSYTRERTLEVASQLNALSDDWQSFIFVTDPHYASNEMHSQSVALYLLSNSSASMLVLGGDYCDGNFNLNGYKAWTEEFRTGENQHYIHCLVGNHERFGGDSSLPTALANIYSDFLADKVNELSGNLEQDYYYMDSEAHKTRYVFLNTSDGSDATTLSDTQLAWVRQVVQLPDSTWHLVVIAHVNVSSRGGGSLQNRADLIDAIETCNGTIVGYFCGHWHVDGITKVSDKIYELTMLCDRYSAQYPDNNGVSREAGTYTENVVSVVSFNTKTKQVVMRRVGAGNDQMLSYSYANSA